MTALKDDNKKYVEVLNNDIKGKKLFYIKEICNIDEYEEVDEELTAILNNFKAVLEKCREIGFIVEEVSFDKNLLKTLYPTYMSISCAEATSNNANLTGILFGPRGEGNTIEEVCFQLEQKVFRINKKKICVRKLCLTKENKEKLFLNACRVRRLVVDKINELFKQYDGLILPAIGSIALK